jgi:hypothetical protein
MFLTAIYLFIAWLTPGVWVNTTILLSTVLVDMFSWGAIAWAHVFAPAPKYVTVVNKHIHRRK